MDDVQEILSPRPDRRDPGIALGTQFLERGVPVILDRESNAGEAYNNMVARYLGEDLPHRFLQVQKKGLFGRLFGG